MPFSFSQCQTAFLLDSISLELTTVSEFSCKSEPFHHQNRSVITVLCVCGWTERLLALVAAAIIAACPDSFHWQVRAESGLLFGPIWSSHISLMEMAAFVSCCGDRQSFTGTPKSTLPTRKQSILLCTAGWWAIKKWPRQRNNMIIALFLWWTGDLSTIERARQV